MKKIFTCLTMPSLFLFVGCASPSLQYYTLTKENGVPAPASSFNTSNNAPVLYISRLTVPDYLNTTDITTREGTLLNHSVNARMSSILSVGATELITNFLTDKNPNLWITNEAPLSPATYQLMINIARFDLQAEPNKMGRLTLEATWSTIPNDTKISIQKHKTSFVIEESINTNNEIIQLEQKALIKLANDINTSIHQFHLF